MSSDFQVGDEVICVDVDPHDTTMFPANLKKLTLGAVYTISALSVSGGPHEIPVAQIAQIEKAWWEAYRFRKVQKTFTGMGLLRGLLNTNTKELVDG